MKTIKNLLIALLFFTISAKAQYTTNAEVTKELESTMDNGELANVRYFYYPNLQAYFDRQTATYIYTRNGNDWLESDTLPSGLRGYSSANGNKVAITDYDGDTPFDNIKEDMQKYPANYSSKRQPGEKEMKCDNSSLASK
jgi:hypothetical protein